MLVKRVGETSWILRPRKALEGRTVDVLRDTFLEAADRGAQNVVVDLSDAHTVAGNGAATLVTMAELMLGRGGVLWIAACWNDRAGHTLRPIETLGPDALVGVTTALDAALEPLKPETQRTVANRSGDRERRERDYATHTNRAER